MRESGKRRAESECGERELWIWEEQIERRRKERGEEIEGLAGRKKDGSEEEEKEERRRKSEFKQYYNCMGIINE